MHYSLGFLSLFFSVATAQLFVDGVDQNGVPQLVVPKLPDLTDSTPITLNLDSESDDFRNLISVNSPSNPNLPTNDQFTSGIPSIGAQNPSNGPTFDMSSNTVPINQFTSGILSTGAQNPSSGLITVDPNAQTGLYQGTDSSMETAINYANAETDTANNSPHPCGSASTTVGKKRRGQASTACVQWGSKREELLAEHRRPLRKNARTKGALTPEQWKRNAVLSESDTDFMKALLENEEDPRWNYLFQSPCEPGSHRQVPLCCMGPPVAYPVKKRQAHTNDLNNCQEWVPARPMCINPDVEGLDSRHCCLELNFAVQTTWGWMGVDCVRFSLPLPIPDTWP